MNKLGELQTAFQAYLLDSSHDQIHSAIISTKKMPADKRLAIYSYAYYARLVEALAASYPSLLTYMGFDDFYKIGCEYAKAYPSTYRSIRWFGDRFAVFLQQHYYYKDHPHVAEIATIEWTMSAVFDAADHRVLHLEELSAIAPDAWENMRLEAHPSVHRLNLTYNSVEIWQALIKDTQPNSALNTPIVPWVFWRNALTNQFCSLEKEDAWALDCLLQGSTFGTLCEGLTQWQPEEEVGLRAASLLKGWILAGLLSRAILD
jgi:hypothetical protein